MEKYDYLIVGSGLFGATCANLLNKANKKVLVIDRRPNIAGNVYTEKVEGINVHKYGAHIFHTDYEDVWKYVNSFVEFNRYTNSPVARYKDDNRDALLPFISPQKYNDAIKRIFLAAHEHRHCHHLTEAVVV